MPADPRLTRWLATLAGAALLGGCAAGASTSTPRPARPGAAVPVRSPSATRPRTARPVARLQSAPGLEGVIGTDAAGLLRQFGPPRLDVREDDARKLQWSGTACILDAYLYPVEGSAEPVAAYVDARRGDGRDVDRADCVRALRR